MKAIRNFFKRDSEMSDVEASFIKESYEISLQVLCAERDSLVLHSWDGWSGSVAHARYERVCFMIEVLDKLIFQM